jgi:hypothetical protein
VIVAIHQPNYAPWLGYFNKMAQCDAFVFLDDVQYSRGGYTNRVRIEGGWLTQPIKREFGSLIYDTRFAITDWPARHLDTLRGAYRQAPAFKQVWPLISRIWQDVPTETLALANRHIVEALAAVLNITPNIHLSSELPTDTTGDRRLAQIVRALGGSVYLSGKGGANYQLPETFGSIELRYISNNFTGLSVLDSLFHLGVDGVREMIK